jgi:hypothetical protein
MSWAESEKLNEWIERAFENGKKEEQERIIKLLETWGEDAGCFCCASDVAASEIIALIKGEQ